VEAFLIHELAHVCCGDYLVNLGQGLVEGLLFHPPGLVDFKGNSRRAGERL